MSENNGTQRPTPWESRPTDDEMILVSDATEFPIAKFYTQSEADRVLRAVNRDAAFEKALELLERVSTLRHVKGGIGDRLGGLGDAIEDFLAERKEGQD